MRNRSPLFDQSDCSIQKSRALNENCATGPRTLCHNCANNSDVALGPKQQFNTKNSAHHSPIHL